MSAIIAGLIMTVLTWLILAVRNVLGRILVIWAAGYVVFAANTSHAVVGAALIFVGFSHTGHSWLDVAAWVGIATAGNLVGGVGLVTIFRLAQTSETARRNRRR
ncbi:MAG: formate/nitrite transporter family protein [Candidatus Dormibacteria bacterium]